MLIMTLLGLASFSEKEIELKTQVEQDGELRGSSLNFKAFSLRWCQGAFQI